MDKEDLGKKIATVLALGAIGIGALTIIVLLLVFCYHLSVWLGVFSTAALLIAIGGITLKIISDEGYY